MISVMNNEFELDRKSDVAPDLPFYKVESPVKSRVSGDTLSELIVDGSNRVFDSANGGTEGLMTSTMESEKTRVSSELDSGKSESKMESGDLYLQSSGGSIGFRVGNVEAEKMGFDEARVSSELDFQEMDRKMEARVSENTAEDMSLEHSTRRDEEGAGVSSGETKGGDGAVTEERTVLDFDSLYSMVDEGSATGMLEAFGSEAAKVLSYGFKPGDMVWGKVKSHPWWPGHIFTEAFATPSVRRSKREGHILVAFFGDSSYGWFDPAELVPFEPHYAEKSRQTNSRTFVKAVEEAVDEASRRHALGLACCCRNPFNFRPMNVQGYFVVDVGNYEAGGVYSANQIKKARDSFQPAEALSFVQQLALTPRNGEQRSFDWIKHKAMIFAYRKAVFEEFDETYAQAFGMQPVRPSRDSMGLLDQTAKVPSRAPLSGPLVIAEALGERKSSAKPIKVKDQLKKDRYLFKRRDELNKPRANNISQGHTGFAAPSAFKEGAAARSPGDYVFQKKPPAVSMKPQVPVKQEVIGTISCGGAALTQGGTGQEAEAVDRKLVVPKCSLVDAQVNMSRVNSLAGFATGFPTIQPLAYVSTLAMRGGREDEKLCLDKVGALQEMKARMKSDGSAGLMSAGLDGSNVLGKSESPGIVGSFDQNFRPDGDPMVGSKHEESVKVSSTLEGFGQQPKLRLSMPVEDRCGPDQAWEVGGSRNVSESVGIDVQLPIEVLGVGIDKVVKKAKVLKRPGEDLSSEKSVVGEKKKKKTKEESGLETSLGHPQKRLKTAKDGESVRKSAGKPIGVGLVPKESLQVSSQRKDDGGWSTFLSSDSPVMLPEVDLGNIEVELPQLLSDLLALALDPFHGVERNSPKIVRQVLLRFRSLIYQKSLLLAPPSEADNSELRATRSPASTGAAEAPSIEDARDLPSASKELKHLARSDDPTKAGRKRSLSDRQEMMSVKRLKKLNEMKSMAAEKKAGGQKIPEVQRVERKETGLTVPAKPIKMDTVKKPELPVRVAQPAMLVMKFPPRTTLPSIPELKARFVRFGPLDHSAIRVFWKSSTCRVVFKHKSHAQAAHNYAIRNNALFGHVKVNYHLRDLEAPASEVHESAKRRLEDTSDEVPQFRPGSGNDSAGEPRSTPLLQRPAQPTVQLKSCLKKPSSDEAGPAMGVPREGPRVKFMLGGEESSRGEQLVVSSSNNNNGSSADGGASSSLAMDINSKNIQKVIPPVLPLLPLPRIPDVDDSRGVGHFSKVQRTHYSEVESRNNHNYNIIHNNSIDISHQMLSLLMRCSDIVTNVKFSLGYVPYHPL